MKLFSKKTKPVNDANSKAKEQKGNVDKSTSLGKTTGKKEILKKDTTAAKINEAKKSEILDVNLPENNPTTPAIQINDFTKGFGNFVAVKRSNFSVGRGVIHGFLGHNGCGKTTTIKTIIGSYRLNIGKIAVFGYPVGTAKANSFIGYIPESARFPKRSTCMSYLITMARLSGVKAGYASKVASSILRDTGLYEFRFKNPNNFSSGMQKKILLAQALINDPRVLILDEPAENLDPAARKQLYDELIRLRRMGKSIFISSHVLAELEPIIDELTIMKEGRVIYSGNVDAVVHGAIPSYFVHTDDDFKLSNALTKEGLTHRKTLNGIVISGVSHSSQISILQRIIQREHLTTHVMIKNRKSLQEFYQEVADLKYNAGNVSL